MHASLSAKVPNPVVVYRSPAKAEMEAAFEGPEQITTWITGDMQLQFASSRTVVIGLILAKSSVFLPSSLLVT
jgi:hypothetical protein